MTNTSTNDFVLNIATVNGSGSQSANLVLLKSLFRMGIPVGGKNVFPSNIAGLPTWFWIRANDQGFVGRKSLADIVVAMNPSTLQDDIQTVRPGGFFIYNSDLPQKPNQQRTDIQWVPVPFKTLVDSATDAIKIKKLLINMIYVGVLAQLLKVNSEDLDGALKNQLGGKESVLEANRKALRVGWDWAAAHLQNLSFPFVAEKRPVKDQVLMDGNTASAMGLLFGGCTVGSWYPITPSTSLMETFQNLCRKYRVDASGKNNFAVLQAEDELAAIGMVLGAGWAGARAMTATSGPGVSLMAEAAGFSYFAEIPAVIWNVQRAGPSTGLPTRTLQGDLLESVFLSHGDTKHPCLIPGNIQECFEFGQTCFDLAERLQQLVIVLSDLELGMNVWAHPRWAYPEKPFDRGKVLSEKDLEKHSNFARYKDIDGDGIPYRTLPGTRHPAAAYFTRGTGHNENAGYSEKAADFEGMLTRLHKKWETAKSLVPAPRIQASSSKLGLISYGAVDIPVEEALFELKNKGLAFDYMRLRSIPFCDQVEQFIQSHNRVYILDQNRDGQMHKLLGMEFPHLVSKMISVTHFDGTPLPADFVVQALMEKES